MFGAELIFFFTFFNILVSIQSAALTENFSDMRWKPGDIIACRLNGILGTLFAKHYMLVIDNDKVINVVGDKQSHEGTILIQNRAEAGGFNKSKCVNIGSGKLEREEALNRSKKWENVEVYYDLFRCNCEHWVRYWADGSSGGFFDNQSLLPTNKKCAV